MGASAPCSPAPRAASSTRPSSRCPTWSRLTGSSQRCGPRSPSPASPPSPRSSTPFFHKKDAYYDPRDPLPSLALLYVHLPTLLARNIYKGNNWAKIDPCIGKMTEENGD